MWIGRLPHKRVRSANWQVSRWPAEKGSRSGRRTHVVFVPGCRLRQFALLKERSDLR